MSKVKPMKLKQKKKAIKVISTKKFSIVQGKEKDDVISDLYSNLNHVIICAKFCFHANWPLFGKNVCNS